MPERDPCVSSPRGDRAALHRQVISGLRWSAAAYYVNMAVRLLVSVALARLLSPDDFGLVALGLVVVSALGLLQDSGLSAALVPYGGPIGAAANTVLVATTAAGVALGAALWLGAPLAAHWTAQPGLTPVLQALALVLVVRGAGKAPRALLQRDMEFRTLASLEFGGTIIYGLTGIALARAGAGPWSLVAGQLALETWSSLACWWHRPVRPAWSAFDWSIARELAGFGRHMVAANVLGAVQVQLPTLVVGASLGAFSLGLYEMALRWAWMPVTGITHVTSRVSYPAFARLRHDRAAFAAGYRSVLQGVIVLALPSAVGLTLVAEPLIAALYDDRWLGTVPVLRVLAFFGLLHAVAASTGEVFKALGRPGWVTLYAVVYDVVLAGALWVLGARFGLVGVGLGTVLAPAVVMLASVVTAARLLRTPLRGFATLLGGPLVATAAMAVAVAAVAWAVERMGGGPWALLATAVPAGVAVYGLVVARLEPVWWQEALASIGLGGTARPALASGAGHAAG